MKWKNLLMEQGEHLSVFLSMYWARPIGWSGDLAVFWPLAHVHNIERENVESTTQTVECFQNRDLVS